MADRIDGRESLETMIENHDTQLRLLTGIAERQQSLLEQIQRDSAQTQRLWVNLSKKYGWLDSEDLT